MRNPMQLCSEQFVQMGKDMFFDNICSLLKDEENKDRSEEKNKGRSAEENMKREPKDSKEGDADENMDNYTEDRYKEERKERKVEENMSSADKSEERDSDESKKKDAEDNEKRDIEKNDQGSSGDRSKEENKERGAEETKESNSKESHEREAEISKQRSEEIKEEDRHGEENNERDRQEDMLRNTEETKKRYPQNHKERYEEENKATGSEESKKRDPNENKDRYAIENMEGNAEDRYENDNNEILVEEYEDADKIREIKAEEKRAEDNKEIIAKEITKCHLNENKERYGEECEERNAESKEHDAMENKKKNTDENKDVLDYLNRPDVSVENKFETVFVKGKVTEEELENYYYKCWKYKMCRDEERRRALDEDETSSDEEESGTEDDSDDIEEDGINSDKEEYAPPKPTVHAWWCLVCGKEGCLIECPKCPSTFHPACKHKWLVTIFHRNKQLLPESPNASLQKNLSDTISSLGEVKEVELDTDHSHCPSCTWGPRIGVNDIVWHKFGSCPWWPARVLALDATPSWLTQRAHYRGQMALRYYGTLEHSWASTSRMCLFLPWHAEGRPAGEPDLRRAYVDACDEYIAVYLT